MKLITLTSSKQNGGDFTTNLNPPIRLKKGSDKNYEVALVSASICRGWPTISEELKNNKLQYRLSSTDTWKTITFPDGNYTLDLLNNYLKGVMKAVGHYNAGVDTTETATSDDIYYIVIGANSATGRVKITIGSTYEVNLNPTISTVNYYMGRDVLGFTSSVLAASGTSTEYVGANVPDFNRGVNQIQIRSDIVDPNGAYVNGSPGSVLYAFTPNSPPYGYMSVMPFQAIFLPLAAEYIGAINLRITDQDGNALNTGGERSTITIVLRAAS